MTILGMVDEYSWYFKSVIHFLMVDFGEGYLLVSCDGGKAKSTPGPTNLDCTVRLGWSLIIFDVCGA